VIHPGLLTIDFGALAANWRLLSERVAPAVCGAVVKADAYGTGAADAGPALYRAGCRNFFVAHASEGAALRRALPQADSRIFVLNGLEPDADPIGDYCAHRLMPAIGSEAEFQRWRARAPASMPFALHVDTGMRRLGFDSAAELHDSLARHGAQGVELVMSHFVSAEAPGDPLNDEQIDLFAEARLLLPGVPGSLANSSGAFLAAKPYGDLVRPGYALYGGNPILPQPNPMACVVTLEIAIQQIRWIEAGETCGYNSLWTARRRTRLATILAGYADGLPRGAGAIDGRPGAEVAISGARCKLVGRMSMDLCIADVTDLPEDSVRPGTRAEFFGPTIPLDDFAARSGTIGYHLLTSLGRRYERRTISP